MAHAPRCVRQNARQQKVSVAQGRRNLFEMRHQHVILHVFELRISCVELDGLLSDELLRASVVQRNPDSHVAPVGIQRPGAL